MAGTTWYLKNESRHDKIEGWIKQIQNPEQGETDLYGRQLDSGEWEYVIVRWLHDTVSVIAKFSEGKLTKEQSINITFRG